MVEGPEEQSKFRALAARYERLMFHVARQILPNEQDAEDAVQEAVCRAFYKIGGLRQPRYFKTWLTRILINCCYDVLREQKGLVPLEVLPEDGREEYPDLSLDVRETLRSLGENDRLALTLFYFNDMSIRDIARLLTISEDAVKQRLAHGRKRFRQAYGEREQEKEAVRHEA